MNASLVQEYSAMYLNFPIWYVVFPLEISHNAQKKSGAKDQKNAKKLWRNVKDPKQENVNTPADSITFVT